MKIPEKKNLKWWAIGIVGSLIVMACCVSIGMSIERSNRNKANPLLEKIKQKNSKKEPSLIEKVREIKENKEVGPEISKYGLELDPSDPPSKGQLFLNPSQFLYYANEQGTRAIDFEIHERKDSEYFYNSLFARYIDGTRILLIRMSNVDVTDFGEYWKISGENDATDSFAKAYNVICIAKDWSFVAVYNGENYTYLRVRVTSDQFNKIGRALPKYKSENDNNINNNVVTPVVPTPITTIEVPEYQHISSPHGEAPCKGCNATGKCSYCGGVGFRKVSSYDYELGETVIELEKCGICRGSGNCGVCFGRGTIHY